MKILINLLGLGRKISGNHPSGHQTVYRRIFSRQGDPRIHNPQADQRTLNHHGADRGPRSLQEVTYESKSMYWELMSCKVLMRKTKVAAISCSRNNSNDLYILQVQVVKEDQLHAEIINGVI